MNKPTILYMGSPNAELSHRPLRALIDAGYLVRAVIVPGLRDEPDPVPLDPPEEEIPGVDFIPLVTQYMAPGIITVAWEEGIPVIAIGDLKTKAAQTVLTQLLPDLIVVSCYSKIIPPAILDIAPALNLHPSLLPRYRGPWPLFWQFKNGETKTGVSLHLVTGKLDAGDVVAQTPVKFPDGCSAIEAEALAAAAGSKLLLAALADIEAGTPTATPQNEAEATYQGLPSRSDLKITTDQPAHQAYSFIRGAAPLIGNEKFEVVAGGETFLTRTAVEYSMGGSVGAPFKRDGNEVWIQFTPGRLHIRTE